MKTYFILRSLSKNDAYYSWRAQLVGKLFRVTIESDCQQYALVRERDYRTLCKRFPSCGYNRFYFLNDAVFIKSKRRKSK
jgi:hypothetical protein